MDKIQKLKEIDLLNYIESAVGQRAVKVGIDTYKFKKCPLCGGGDHFTIKPSDQYFNTWKKCGAGSIIDFYMSFHGKDQKEAIQELFKEFGLNDSDFSFNRKELKEVKKEPKQTAQSEKKVADLTPFVQDYYNTNSQDYSYFFERLLLSAEYMDDTDIDNFDRLVFENKFIVANPKDVFPIEFLPKVNNIDAYEYIIPVWNDAKVVNCILRRNNTKSTENNKTLNLKGLGVKFFNSDYLKNEKRIFVTEGVFDCLSLEMLGYKSICLNSTNMSNKFIELVNNNIDTCKDSTFILAFDNDDAGNKAKETIYKALKELNLKVSILSFGKTGQDINDYYLEDLEGLKNDIEAVFRPQTVYSYLDKYLSNVEENHNTKPASTGFKQLDEKLNGGLYPGLYCLGAISSLGKTALTLQIADNLAANGQHVLFYSLEMPQDELISRSLSRIMFEIDYEKCCNIGTIQVHNRHIGGCMEEYKKAIEQYRNTIAKRLQIIQGDFSMTADTIVESVESFISSTGIKPIVFIDYLQIVKSSLDKGYSEKQGVDDIVVKLKMLSRDNNIPVFVVSAFNRANYATPVNYESFKESGSIEYTSDFVLGLQLSVLDDIDTDRAKRGELQAKLNAAKVTTPRKVTLVTLKNRNGKSFNNQKFTFHARNNMFNESYEPEFD